MGLAPYIGRRLLQMVVVLFVVSVTVFVIVRVLPGDPVSVIIGLGPVKPETIQSLRAQMGLDHPLHVQYWLYMRDLLSGNLGYSWHTGQPVLKDLVQRLPASAELAFYSLLVGLLVGVPMGVLSAVRRDGVADRLIRIVSLSGVSVPIFWLGIVLVYILYYNLGVVPAPVGRVSEEFKSQVGMTGFVTLDALLTLNGRLFLDGLSHMILPVLVLSSESLSYITRMVRSSMLDVLSKQYVTVSRAKGLSERTVIYRHALRNALIPVVTVVAMAAGRLLGGAVLVEIVFNWPGAGRYIVDALLARDYGPVQGFILLFAGLYALINLAVDISYGFLDPRIRYE